MRRDTSTDTAGFFVFARDYLGDSIRMSRPGGVSS